MKDWERDAEFYDMKARLIRLEGEAQERQEKAEIVTENNERALVVITQKDLPVETKALNLRKLTDERLVKLCEKGITLERITATGRDFSINEVAKKLAYPGLGPNELMRFLRERGILSSNKQTWNKPMAEYVNDKQYFKEAIKPMPKEKQWMGTTYLQVRVTPDGIDFIRRIYERFINSTKG